MSALKKRQKEHRPGTEGHSAGAENAAMKVQANDGDVCRFMKHWYVPMEEGLDAFMKPEQRDKVRELKGG